LQGEIDELRSVVAEQRALLEELRDHQRTAALPLADTAPAEIHTESGNPTAGGAVVGSGPVGRGQVGSDAVRTGRGWTRRGLLLGGLSAAAGAAATVAGATPAAAATGDMQFGAANNATTSATSLTSTHASETLLISNTGAGQGLEVVANGSPALSARADSNGIAFQASASSGVAVFARSSTGANLRLAGSGRETVPKLGTWIAGDFVTVTPGPPNRVEVWLCVVGGTPGQWRLIASSASAGAFVPIVPVRVYDSRWVGVPGLVTGIITPGTVRTIPVANGRSSTGTVTQPNAVPAGASAVTMNITVDNTVERGNIAIVPGGVLTSATSSINWSSTGMVVANGITVRLNATDRTVNALGRSNNANLIVDVTGYYASA
jgi:hypothetical protein